MRFEEKILWDYKELNFLISDNFLKNNNTRQENTYAYKICFWLLLSCFSRVQLFVTLWTVAHKAPLSMGFSRQEYRSGLPCPGIFPTQGLNLHLLRLLPCRWILYSWATREAPLDTIKYQIVYLYINIYTFICQNINNVCCYCC